MQPSQPQFEYTTVFRSAISAFRVELKPKEREAAIRESSLQSESLRDRCRGGGILTPNMR